MYNGERCVLKNMSGPKEEAQWTQMLKNAMYSSLTVVVWSSKPPWKRNDSGWGGAGEGKGEGELGVVGFAGFSALLWWDGRQR